MKTWPLSFRGGQGSSLGQAGCDFSRAANTHSSLVGCRGSAPQKGFAPHHTALQNQPPEPSHPQQQQAFSRVRTNKTHPAELSQQSYIPYTEPKPEAGRLLASTCVKPSFAPLHRTALPAFGHTGAGDKCRCHNSQGPSLCPHSQAQHPAEPPKRLQPAGAAALKALALRPISADTLQLVPRPAGSPSRREGGPFTESTWEPRVMGSPQRPWKIT